MGAGSMTCRGIKLKEKFNMWHAKYCYGLHFEKVFLMCSVLEG